MPESLEISQRHFLPAGWYVEIKEQVALQPEKLPEFSEEGTALVGEALKGELDH